MGKILVVDDIATNRKLLRQILVAVKNYEVIEAVNGLDALEIYEKELPDLILMDINMPGMGGFESATKIKKLTGDNYIPIIFVTAMSESSLSNALASGGDDFISKPFDVEVLESKINAHLRIRELSLKLNSKNEQLYRQNEYLTHEQNVIEYFFENALKHSYLDEKYIKYHMSPMSTFNGDVLMVERGVEGGLIVIMGDFTGHGLTAAMGTLPVAMIFFKMVAEGCSLNEIARELNSQLKKLMPTSMFFAATLLELNSTGDTLSVWSGCMPDVFLLGINGKLKKEIKAKNMALGVLNDDQFESEVDVYKVCKGDRIYLYSDGITEALGADGKMFGGGRVKEVLIENGDDRFDRVLSELKSFTESDEQNDDITLVELTCDELSI